MAAALVNVSVLPQALPMTTLPPSKEKLLTRIWPGLPPWGGAPQPPWVTVCRRGAQLSEPESSAEWPATSSAWAMGLGWFWQAASGVVGVLEIVTVTDLPPWMSPRLQRRK